jgi:hypothetical protein
MNNELRLELKTQGNDGNFQGREGYRWRGGSFKRGCFHCGMPGLHKGGNKFCQWKKLSQAGAIEKGLKFAIDALQGANYKVLSWI